VNSGDRFRYQIWFQPSIRFGSAHFSVHVCVQSDELSAWRAAQRPEELASPWKGPAVAPRGEFADVVLSATLASLTRSEQAWPVYDVKTLAERERSIAEVTAQIRDFALPFFERFRDLDSLVRDVRAHGFLPHWKKLSRIDGACADEFCKCFEGKA
jgi:hypothetical protein